MAREPSSSTSSSTPCEATESKSDPSSASSSSSAFTAFVQNVNSFMFTDEDYLHASGRAADSLLASVTRPDHDGIHADTLPRLPEESEESSRGSLPALTNPHAAGTCQPCVLFAATVGCHKGERCQFCHMPHAPDARSTTRGVRKHTRDSIKQRVLGLLRPPVDLDAIHSDLQGETDRHPFGRKLIIKLLQETPEEYRLYRHLEQVENRSKASSAGI